MDTLRSMPNNLSWLFGLLFRNDVIDASKRVQSARESDVRQTLGQRINQILLAVAHIDIAPHMAFDLAFAPAERADCGEDEKLSGLGVESLAAEDVAEAKG